MKFFVLLLFIITGNVAAAQTGSRSITTDADRELIPEGIAVYKNTIYISSINKHLIIAVDDHGKTKNFITPDQDGYLEGLGMKADTVNGLLWALSNIKDSIHFTSQVHAFEIATGKTKYHYKIMDTVPHLFNDLELDAAGNVYISDTYHSAIYIYDPRLNKLENFLKTPYLNYPNGVALGNENTLYVATYENGIMQLNLKTKALKQLNGYTDSTIAHGLDGLVYRNHTLTGVYNIGDDRSTNAVIQYQLDAAGKKIISEKFLDKGNPAFYEPTTAVLQGNTLYVIANSHLAFYNKNKESTKGIEDNLLPPIVLVYKLLP